MQTLKIIKWFLDSVTLSLIINVIFLSISRVVITEMSYICFYKLCIWCGIIYSIIYAIIVICLFIHNSIK